MAALHAILDLELHVVAQVVEAELVVGAVGDVGAVGFAALLVAEVVDDDADGEAEELVDLAHPLGVALGEVVVDGDDVHAVAGEGVEVAGERGDEGFAFAGLHFGDLALVQHHAADQLHVEVAHLHGAPAGLAHHGEGLGQNLIERFVLGLLDLFGVGDAFEARGDARAEFGRFGPQLLVGELLRLRLKRIDGAHDRQQALDDALVCGAKDLGKCCIEKHAESPFASVCGGLLRKKPGDKGAGSSRN